MSPRVAVLKKNIFITSYQRIVIVALVHQAPPGAPHPPWSAVRVLFWDSAAALCPAPLVCHQHCLWYTAAAACCSTIKLTSEDHSVIKVSLIIQYIPSNFHCRFTARSLHQPYFFSL